MCNKEISFEEGKEKVIEVINNGKAFEKFKELVKAHGGNVVLLEKTDLFTKAKYEIKVISDKEGYITKMDTQEIGKISGMLGAGREKKEDKIDYSAGISIIKKTILHKLTLLYSIISY